jgi:hypothetical protein
MQVQLNALLRLQSSVNLQRFDRRPQIVQIIRFVESCSPIRPAPDDENEMETMSLLSNNDTWFVEIDNGNHTTLEVPSTHRKPCTAEEIERRDCHNGGTCFSIKLNESTQTLLCK